MSGFNPVIKWIGSKRIQSAEIIKYFPDYIDTYYEPFCGGCSVIYQLLCSQKEYHTYINKIVCSDINGDLIDLWNTVKNDPKGLLKEYTKMWCKMKEITDRQDKRKYFEEVRDEFNQTRSPYLFFFLMRTTTNGIPRYNGYGEFNNTFHLTRDGIKPKRLERDIWNWHNIVKGNNIEFRRCDYNVIFDQVEDGDFLYLDPPYELTRNTGRYFGKIDYIDFFDRLRIMNEEGIRYAVSYDNEKNEIIVPGDCYENKVNIKSTYGGFRVTTQNIEKTNVFESLYLNF
jgi:DNA adenine methylase